MKCFECGSKCETRYITGTDFYASIQSLGIVAVSKVCKNCGWESHPTKIPESIQETQRPAKRLEPQNIKVFPLSANFNGGGYALINPEVIPPTSMRVIH